jgi:hypothetical protein
MPATNTLQSLIDSACFIAGKEGINRDMVAQLLVPVVFQQVARRYAADELKRPYTLAVLPLTFTGGVAELPNAVIVETLKYGVLVNPLDDTQTKKYRFVSWLEFTRPLTPTSLQLGYFSVNTEMTGGLDPLIYAVEPGSVYAPGAGLTGTMSLTTPVVPTLPTVATDPINAPQQLQQEFVAVLAQMIAGKTEVAA